MKRSGKITGENRELWAPDHNTDAVAETPLTEKKAKGRKSEFCLTEEILDGIRYVPEITISDFVAQINELRDEKQMKRLTIKQLTQNCWKKAAWNRGVRMAIQGTS